MDFTRMVHNDSKNPKEALNPDTEKITVAQHRVRAYLFTSNPEGSSSQRADSPTYDPGSPEDHGFWDPSGPPQTSDKGKGDEIPQVPEVQDASPKVGTSHDTSDIIQKKSDFLSKMNNRSIINILRDVLSMRVSTGSRSDIQMIESCDKIKLYHRLVNKQTETMLKRTYGEITEAEAITSAYQLKIALDSLSINNNSKLGQLRQQINQCYQDAGLS